MGLVQGCEQGLISRARRATYWHFAVSLVVIACVAGAFGDAARELLMYDRHALENDQYWRFITAHVVHLNAAHLLLNMLGLVLTWFLVGANYSVPEWILVTLVSIAFQGVGFWLLDSQMLWYVGISGLLHGFMLAGAIRGLRIVRAESLLLGGLVVAKLIYEQLLGPLPGSESTAGGGVVVNAHLYGALGGAAAALLLWRRGATKAAI